MAEAAGTEVVADRLPPWRVYSRLLGAEVRSTLEYPGSFALGLVSSMLLTGMELVAIAAVFSNVDELVGWSAAEVLLLHGVASTGFYLADLAIGQLDHLPDLVRTGKLDVLLLRPRRVLPQIVAGDVDLRSIGKVVQGLAVLVTGLVLADVEVGPASIAARLGVAVVGALGIYVALWIATTAICFWLIDAREVSAAFTYGGREVAAYPIGVYGPWLRHLARFVVPVAFTGYYPVLGLLGRDDPLGGPSWAAWAGPFVAVVALAVASGVWRAGIRSYRSAGA